MHEGVFRITVFATLRDISTDRSLGDGNQGVHNEYRGSGSDHCCTEGKRRSVFALAGTVLEGVETLANVNLQATESGLAQTQAIAIKTVESAGNPQEWIALQGGLFAPLTEKRMSYGASLFDIAPTMRSAIMQTAEAHYERCDERMQALTEEAGKHVPRVPRSRLKRGSQRLAPRRPCVTRCKRRATGRFVRRSKHARFVRNPTSLFDSRRKCATQFPANASLCLPRWARPFAAHVAWKMLGDKARAVKVWAMLACRHCSASQENLVTFRKGSIMSKLKWVLCSGVVMAMLIGVAAEAAAASEDACIPFDPASAVFCSVVGPPPEAK
ncbi:TIGR01841 family phasin [Paraburkholderia nodosa]|uniref:TIGR01841 family phasin n=1 Tax=Paraburkholderia nodosa TaxID=392320 RepID=UPI0009DD8E07